MLTKSVLQERAFRRLSSEDGSVVMAVIVVAVCAIAVAASLQTVQSGLGSARIDQNRTNAFQLANAGIDHAVYRIDSRNLPTAPSGSYAPTLTGGVVTAFTDAVTVASSTFTIAAQRDPTGVTADWTVRSTGTDRSGRKRVAAVSLPGKPLFPSGFFTTKQFSITGNQTTPLWFRASQCPSLATNVAACELALPIATRLGTNGTVSGSGVGHFAQEWQGFDMYGRATEQAAQTACSGCPASQVRNYTNALDTTPPPAPAGVQPCPFGGTIVGPRTIQPGDYLCPSLAIIGVMTVGTGGNGTGTVRFWVQSGGAGLSIAGTVNKGAAPGKLQFFMPARPDGSAQSGAVCDSEIWAYMFTPGLSINCNGSHQPTIYGAVIANAYVGSGNHFDFHWDADSANLVSGAYAVRNWRECAASAPVC